MKIELELWHVLSLGIAVLGAFFALAKLMLSSQLSHIAAGFAAQNTRLEKIEQASREDANNWQRAERELLLLKAELPLNYVRREDYMQTVATIMAKLDAISLRMENILLKGKGAHHD